MATEEKPYHVVWPTHNGHLVAPPIACDTRFAALQAAEDARDNDEQGWYAEYPIRQMTASELAHELSG